MPLVVTIWWIILLLNTYMIGVMWSKKTNGRTIRVRKLPAQMMKIWRAARKNNDVTSPPNGPDGNTPVNDPSAEDAQDGGYMADVEVTSHETRRQRVVRERKQPTQMMKTRRAIRLSIRHFHCRCIPDIWVCTAFARVACWGKFTK